jgi:hypothetical protein
MFIKRLELTSDASRILGDLRCLISNEEGGATWAKMNQIGLNSRANSENKWEDATGSLYDRVAQQWRGTERDFNVWNLDESWYVRQQIEILQKTLNVELGRIRIMRLLPKTGLSVHKDQEMRYHLVLQTNPKAYISHATDDLNLERSVLPTAAACYHMPCDNTWYEIDTREVHWVYNGGEQERIHLVVCGV